jgi:hypothetical protein
VVEHVAERRHRGSFDSPQQMLHIVVLGTAEGGGPVEAVLRGNVPHVRLERSIGISHRLGDDERASVPSMLGKPSQVRLRDGVVVRWHDASVEKVAFEGSDQVFTCPGRVRGSPGVERPGEIIVN